MREYDDVMEILDEGGWQCVDHLAEVFAQEDEAAEAGEAQPKGPRCTFGDVSKGAAGNLMPREVVLTDPDEFCCEQRLDYIFEMRQPHAQQHGLQVVSGATQIEAFFTEAHLSDDPGSEQTVYHLPFTQISDHYGVSTELTFS